MCTSDKKMFTAVADPLSCPFEVSIYSEALYQETVLSLLNVKHHQELQMVYVSFLDSFLEMTGHCFRWDSVFVVIKVSLCQGDSGRARRLLHVVFK